MTLTQDLAHQRAHSNAMIPANAQSLMAQATDALRASGILDRVLTVGDRIPAIALPSATGQTISIPQLLAQGPVVISLYRGQWCPYCNLELRALQTILPEITAHGATLVAISPQTPDNSLSTTEKHELTYTVLSDVGNRVARSFGLVFEVSPELRPIYQGFGIDLPGHNGDESYELPIPATYVVAPDGAIAHAFIDIDYTQRLDPDDIVQALKQLAVNT